MFSLIGRPWRAPLVRAALALLALPALLCPLASLAAKKAPAPAYHFVSNWPYRYGKGVPEWRGADVTGVAVDPQGNVYTCLGTSHPVIKFDAKGHYAGFFGDQYLIEPHTIRIDPEGNLWMTDFLLGLIFKFAPDGTLLRQWGTRSTPGADATHFWGPADVAFAPSGDVYIADGHWNNRIVRMDHDGNVLGWWGSAGKAPGQFNTPHSVAVDAQNRVWVADRGNQRLQVFTPTGQFITQLPLPDQPFSVFITPDQTVYVGGGKGFYAYTMEGQLITAYLKHGKGAGKVYEAHMICVDGAKTVYEADASGKRVQKFTLK